MPILRRESEIFPAGLFSMKDGGPWTIVHVRSRQEKAVARLFMERKQPFYLPQIEKEVRRDGRTFKSFIPLFGGYVFIRLTDDTRQTLWSTKAVVRMIQVDDQELLDQELRQIRTLQEAGAVLIAHPEIAAGDAVRIADGVFQGYMGIVVRELDLTRLVVSITALNKSVTAEFPRESVVSTRAATR
jgi:transcription antitermination factor NusG